MGSSWVQRVQPAESLCCSEAATAANGNRPVEVRGTTWLLQQEVADFLFFCQSVSSE